MPLPLQVIDLDEGKVRLSRYLLSFSGYVAKSML